MKQEREIVNVTTVIHPPEGLPYLGQVFPFKDDYWTVFSITKIEWSHDAPIIGVKIHLTLERITKERTLVTDKEVKKAKKAKFKLI